MNEVKKPRRSLLFYYFVVMLVLVLFNTILILLLHTCYDKLRLIIPLIQLILLFKFSLL